MPNETVYPYVLPATVPYHRYALPVYGGTERVEFLYRYKRPTENLFLGKIKLSRIAIDMPTDVLSRVVKYFLNQYFLEEAKAEDIVNRVFPKLCWLTDEFLKFGFQYPISVHYNPRVKLNVIHPGSIRGIVYNLFRTTETADCLYFNTGGVKFEFLKDLRVVDKQELLDQADNIEIEVVADHGSIIPHINLNPSSVTPNVKQWHEFVRRRLTSPNFKIYTNVDMPLFKPWLVSESDATVKIYLDTTKVDESMDDVMLRSAILAVIGKPYKSTWLTITHMDSSV